jgi:hypothetical protein
VLKRLEVRCHEDYRLIRGPTGKGFASNLLQVVGRIHFLVGTGFTAASFFEARKKETPEQVYK